MPQTAIDIITGHFVANKLQSIDVPEWRGEDGTPLRIFWQLLTVERRQQIFADPNRTDADVVAAMAIDADGKRLFDVEAKVRLKMSADAAILTRIATRMLGADRVSAAMVDAAIKN